MNAQQLKNAILQMAVQGKLVPQDSNDEPASVLIERIRVEKEQLIKDKKIKKEKNPSFIFRGADNLPYENIGGEVRCIADEVPFEIPDSWEWVRLGSVSKQVHYGYTASASENGNSRLLRITDIQNNKVNWLHVPYCDIDDKGYSSYGLNNRDIMVARTGGTIGKTYIVRNLDTKAVFASYLIRIIPSNYIDEEYLKLFMESPWYWSQLTAASMGTGQPNVNGQSLSNLLLPLPPFAEQSNIVTQFYNISPSIENYNLAHSKIEKLNTDFPEKLKKSILQWAVQGKLVPQDGNDEPASLLLERIREEKTQLIKDKKIKKDKQESIIFKRDNSHYEKIGNIERCIDDEIPFDIPDSWEWCRLGSIGLWGSGATPSRTNPSYYNGNIPWLKTGDLTDSYIFEIPETITELALEKTSVRLNPIGSVLIAMYGATIGKLGILTIPATTNQACCACQVHSDVYNKYLFYFLMASKTEFIKKSEGGAQPNISKEKIVGTLFPLPPLREQQRIVNKIEELLILNEKL